MSAPRDSWVVGTAWDALHEREKFKGQSNTMVMRSSVLWMRTRAGVRESVVREGAAG